MFAALRSPYARKELRELLPYTVACIAGMVCYFWLVSQPNQQEPYLLSLLVVAGLYTLICTHAVHPISSEFGHETMARLLAQPVSRKQLWWRKHSALAICILVCIASAVSLALFHRYARLYENRHLGTRFYIMLINFAAIAIATGPLMAVYLRQTLTALLATMLTPFALLLFGILVDNVIEAATGFNVMEKGPQFLLYPLLWWIISIGWMVLATWAAYRRFLTMEV